MFYITEIDNAISESFKNYINYGSRSTEKLKPIHRIIANLLENIWGNNYDYHYLDDHRKEKKVTGKYYDKTIDITVTDKYFNVVMCCGIKFVTSNYKQNANNYFENMMGETANIQALSKYPYYQIIILRHNTPYYKRVETTKGVKDSVKYEIIGKGYIEKYIKLINDIDYPHKPRAIAIIFINLDEKSYKVSNIDPIDIFDKRFAELVYDNLSLDNFISNIKNYRKYYEELKIK